MDNKMNDFQQQVAAILGALPVWEQSNLNEAQTSQAIVLRLLAAAGFDIWNPLEVFPEKNSGGKNSYVPDYTLYFENKHKVIIEVKALGKELNDTEKVQSLNYVNALGLRWVILTNGKQWIFLDNDLKGEAAKKVALTLNLLEPHAGEFLEELLQAQLWWAKEANSRVGNLISLIKITAKLSAILATYKGYAHNEHGLQLAIRHELNVEDKQFAETHLPEISTRLFPTASPLVETQAAPIVMSAPTQSSTSMDTWQLLVQHLHRVQAKHKGNVTQQRRFYTVKFGDEHVVFSSMAVLCEAVVETCIQLNCDTKLKFFREDERALVTSHRKYTFRQLSNQQYIAVQFSFGNAMRLIKPLFEALAFPKGSITVSSNDDIKELP